MALTEHRIQVFCTPSFGKRVEKPFNIPRCGKHHVTLETLINHLGVNILNRRVLLDVHLTHHNGYTKKSLSRGHGEPIYLDANITVVEIAEATSRTEAPQPERRIPVTLEGRNAICNLGLNGTAPLPIERILDAFHIRERDGDRLITLNYRGVLDTRRVSQIPLVSTIHLTGIHIGKKNELYHSSPTADTTAAEENQPDAQASNNQNDTKEKLMSHVPVDATVPVQTITVVYGVDVNHMNKGQLFGAATAVKSEIDGLTKANEGIESVSISKQITALQEHLVTIKGLLDAE